MSEMLLASKSDLVAIADKIREKAGISNSLSFPQGFMDSIDEISGQGGSGGFEIPDGYNVGFYDGDHNPLTFMTVTQGLSINPPNYLVKSWHLEDGTTIEFPYTPNGETIIYANDSTYAKTIYNHVGVSAKEYPYMVLKYYPGTYATFDFYVAKELTSSTTKHCYLKDVLQLTSASTAKLSTINLENIVNLFVSTSRTLTSATSATASFNSNVYLLANFVSNVTAAAGVYDLNT